MVRSLTAVLLSVALTGCGTIQHENMVRNQTAQEDIRERNKTARAEKASSDAVRMAAVQAEQMVTVTNPSTAKKNTSICPDLKSKEDEYKKICEDHTEGSGDINIDREEVCGSLRAALDQLHDNCTDGDIDEQTEVVFAPQSPSSAGVNINLTGASTGDIRLIIQSPGAADQSTTGEDDTSSSPVIPESVVTGLTNGGIDLLKKAVPWVAGGYVAGQFADSFSEGLRNAGARDSSVDNSIDNSIGGDNYPPPTPVEEEVIEDELIE